MSVLKDMIKDMNAGKAPKSSWGYLKERGNEDAIKRLDNISVTKPTFFSRDTRIAEIDAQGGNKDSWFKGGAFDDGYDFGDTTKTILGTVGDFGLGAAKGVGRMVEGLVDLGTYGVAGVADLFGAEEFAEKTKNVARYSATDEWTKGATDFVDKYSVLGNKADAISEGIGQIAAIIGTAGIGAAAGLGSAGVAALTTGATGLSSMGTNMGEAYDNNATDGEAFVYGITTGAIEAGTELLAGGLGKVVKALGISRGIGGLDDIFAKKLASKVAGAFANESIQKVVGNTIEFGVKSGGEGLEEVLSGLGSAVMKNLTYMDDKDLKDLIKDENLLEQFVVGTITSSLVQSPSYINANKTGTDFVTGQTLNQERTTDKVVGEYKNAVDENLVNFVQDAKNNTTDNKSVFRLNNVNDRMAEEIEGLTGINAKNYGNVIKANSIRHIIKDHGMNGETDSSMADEADIARIQYVIDNYDTMELLEDKSKEYRDKEQKPAPMVRISKRVNGTYYVVEAVPDTNKHELAVVTAYKKKATEQQTRNANSPHSDARNASDDVAFNNNISQGGSDVNISILGENGKKAFRSNFREGQNENDYASGFRRMYNLGQSNITIEQANAEISGNKYIQSLSPDQRMAAYYAGQNDAKAQLEAEKNAVKFVKYYSEDAGVVENDAAKKVNKEELAAIDSLARSVGTQVVFEEDIEGMNGFIELGKIHISLNAENKLAVVAAHEVTHRMQELAPESYRKYRDFVMSTVGVGVVESYQGKLHSKDIYLSDSEVMDEIAADYTKKILSDPKSMQQFVDDALNGKLDTTASIAENRNILQKLFDSIKEFIKKVSDKFSGRKAEQNQAARDAYGVDLETLKQAKNLLQKALKDSADMGRNLDPQYSKGNAEINGKKKFSVKMNGKEEVIFDRSFAEQVNEVLSKDTDITDGNHVFVCETPSILKQLGFPNLPMLISKGHLRDMNHQEVEGIDKYHGLSEPEINKIPFILENPAMVFKTVSEKNPDAICILSNILDSKKRPMLISIKPNGKGRYNEVRLESNFILSAYGKDDAQNYLNKIGENSDNVNYINKKRTQEMLKGARLQLPAGLSNLRSDIIIHKIDNNVNTQSMQNSEDNSQRKNSVKMDEDLIEKHERLTDAYVMLSAELRRLKNEKRTFRKEKIATVAKKILKDFDFAYDADTFAKQMNGLAEDTRQMIEGKMNFDTFKSKVLEISKDVIETGVKTDSAEYQQSKAMRDYLRTTKITLSEDARNNLGEEYETIRKRTFGRLRLVKEGGTPIDVVYQELSELYPMYFSTETETNASAQLRQIQSVLDGLQSLKSDAFGGYTDEAAEWLSNLMIDQVYNEIFVSGETGKTTVSVDMRAMRDEMADNLQKIMGRERQWREREYNKLQARYEKKTKAYTEARQKAIKIRQVKLHTERLSKALLNPSERFAVPEFLKKPVAEFLQCIDLKNDRMGAKTREMLGDLADTYKAIAEQEYEMSMVVDPELYDHLETIKDDLKGLGVENKTLSDLKLDTLEKLRQSVMAMEASLRNYNKLFIGEKSKQVREAALKIKEELEQKKDKEYLIGTQKASELLNFDLAAPWDFFHQMGPTFEEMYQEGIREGENKFVNNINKAIVYIDESLLKYNLEKSTLEGLTAAKEIFNLQNGQQIELKKADIMSLYLLWRQPDARDHIMEGGIKAAKVSEAVRKKITQNGQTVVKLEWKQKAHKKSVRPSLDDVANIINSLTENEKKFAESISDFFVNECAEWGNEVSLNLYGYKKFMKRFYYPIVSDRMSIPTVAGESADAQIKNKGFTQKRVKGANNPVIIENIFDVYARHTADMAKYNAFVLPLQDMQRVFNYVQRPELDFVEKTAEEVESRKISALDVKNIQSIGRKSVNDFTAEEFKKAEKLAERYFEEMGKKSPFYRAEFGDWRENDSSKVETVRLKENVEDSRGTVKNRDIAMEIGVSRIGIDHIKVHLHNSELANYITNNLKEITEKAIFLDSFVSEPTGGTKHKNSAMLHSFYVPIEFKGKKSIAKLFVEEFFNEWNASVQRRVYDLKEIEVFNDADRFGETNSTPLYASNHTSINTVADLFKIVKKNDKSFNPKKEDIVNNQDDAFSMKELIATKFGEGANDYFNKLMIDINGGMKIEYSGNKMAVASSLVKKSTMGLNMRVALQQPFSYMRAGVLIDDKYLAKAGLKADMEIIFKYSPIARWKSWGFYEFDAGRSMKDLITGKKDIADYTMSLAAKMDEATWKRLWNAVELETVDKHPELQRGSDAFYKVCGKRFDELIDRTQVVDSTLHRPQILRNKNDLVKMSTSYMSEPLKNYNIIRTEALDYASGRTTKKRIARVAWVLTFSTVVLSAFLAGWDKVKSDDDEEKYWEIFAENIIGDQLGMIPYLRDVWSIVRGYDIERMDMQLIGNLADAIRLFGSNKYTTGYKISNACLKIGDLFGIGTSNAKKTMLDMAIKLVSKGTGSAWVEYNYLKKPMYSVKGKPGTFIDSLFKAYTSNNKKEYNKIFKDMIKEGVDAKTIESGLKSRLKKSRIKKTFDVPWNATFELPEAEKEDKFGVDNLTGSQYANYQTKTTALNKEISEGLRRMKSGLTETDYQKRLKAAYEYSVETALEEAARGKYESEKPWINKAQSAEEKYGLEPAEFIMFYRYYNELTPPAGQEKFKSGEKKSLIVDYLNGMELTAEEWQYLYREVAGYKK